MKRNFIENYETPQVDVLEVEIEQGFAASNGWTNGEGYDDEQGIG